MWRISILADIRPMGFHAVVVFGLGKNLLFKSVLGHCVHELHNGDLGEFGSLGNCG